MESKNKWSDNLVIGMLVFLTFGLPMIVIVLKIATDIFDFLYDVKGSYIAIGMVVYIVIIIAGVSSFFKNPDYMIVGFSLLVYWFLPLPVLIFDSMEDDLIRGVSNEGIYYTSVLSSIDDKTNRDDFKELLKEHNIEKEDVKPYVAFTYQEKFRGLVIEGSNFKEDSQTVKDLNNFCYKVNVDCLYYDSETKEYTTLTDIYIEKMFSSVKAEEYQPLDKKYEVRTFN